MTYILHVFENLLAAVHSVCKSFFCLLFLIKDIVTMVMVAKTPLFCNIFHNSSSIQLIHAVTVEERLLYVLSLAILYNCELCIISTIS